MARCRHMGFCVGLGHFCARHSFTMQIIYCFSFLSLVATAVTATDTGLRKTSSSTRRLSTCSSTIIDFSGLSAGEIVTDLGNGIEVVARRRNGKGDLLPANRAMIFDTTNPAGFDPDLKDHVATGTGNALIISRNRNQQDDNQFGGVIDFTFTTPVNLIDSIDFLDIDEDSAATTVSGTFTDDTPFGPILVPSGLDANLQTLEISNGPFNTLSIQLAGSGAIPKMEVYFCDPDSPFSEFDTTFDLTPVPFQYQGFFTSAATRWSSVIVGDLEDSVTVPDSGLVTSTPCAVPATIDDVHICADVAPIDGVSGVLGGASPLFVRDFGLPDELTVLTGQMIFDSADADFLDTLGAFEEVVLHEMAHVYGIGPIWAFRQFTPGRNDPCPYDATLRASLEYQALSGCLDGVPIEEEFGPGTRCVHFDEACFMSELMTGFSGLGTFEISRVTIGGLDDLGYTVNYGAADPYGTAQMNPNCVCNRRMLNSQPLPRNNKNVRHLMSVGDDTMSHSRKLLSVEGEEAAIAYGKSVLADRKSNMENAPQAEGDEGSAMYVGHLFISVLFFEDGEIFEVGVFADELE